MKKLWILLVALVWAGVLVAQKYYEAMYEPAAAPLKKLIEQTPDTDSIVPSVPSVQEEPAPAPVVAPKEEPVAPVVYRVVVGTFSDRTNAMKCYNDLLKLRWNGASYQVDDNGVYRVFYFTGYNEAEARNVLQIAREHYPAAWLKIEK